MPYIKAEDRRRIEDWLADCGGDGCNLTEELASRIECAGELNYVITRIILECLENWGKNYQSMNDIVGALDNAKDEFRRHIQHPYEDEKIVENGDV
jgi:hypothetical protein